MRKPEKIIMHVLSEAHSLYLTIVWKIVQKLCRIVQEFTQKMSKKDQNCPRITDFVCNIWIFSFNLYLCAQTREDYNAGIVIFGKILDTFCTLFGQFLDHYKTIFGLFWINVRKPEKIIMHVSSEGRYVRKVSMYLLNGLHTFTIVKFMFSVKVTKIWQNLLVFLIIAQIREQMSGPEIS